MSAQHDAGHAEWLELWILDGPDALPIERRQELEACPMCAARRGELEAVRKLVDESAAREREKLLGAARALRSYPEERRTLDALRREMHGPTRRAPHWWRWLPVAAAAAVLALGVRQFLSQPERELPDGLMLNGGSVQAFTPLGEVADYTRFAWSSAAAGRWYRLTLRDLDDPDRPDTVIDELEQPQWEPDDEQRARLPARLEWRVEVLDAGGASTAFGGGRAWRSQH